LNNIIAFGDIVAFLFFGCLTDVVARDVVWRKPLKFSVLHRVRLSDVVTGVKLSLLKLQCPVVTICTTRFNNK
jgi:hypothetical protein